MQLIFKLLQDALFAGIAAIGFAAISRPPRKAFLWCGIIAATGHSFRFLLMNGTDLHVHIVIATTLASFLIGIMAVLLSPRTKVPAETYLFPSLLPMIPGIYAYKTFAGLVMCMYRSSEGMFDKYFYLFASNGLTCFFILLGMAIGATIPIFILKRISFQATRHKNKIRF
ncbi:MAG: threonine/serine exporter family protein [Muribaculaceae bacterium]|nr:threonine/serine exporter family protein [Muribaculaceae bacterium]